MLPTEPLKNEPKLKIVREFDDGSTLLSLPRYEEFREAVLRLAKKGVRFEEVAGNKEILVTAIVPADWKSSLAPVAFERPILTSPGDKRVALKVQVGRLHEVVAQLLGQNALVEHIYDY